MEQNGKKKTGWASGGHKNSSQQVRVGASYRFLHFHMRENGNKTKKKTEKKQDVPLVDAFYAFSYEKKKIMHFHMRKKKTGCASGGCGAPQVRVGARALSKCFCCRLG